MVFGQLLYTTALLVWGLAFNRQRAWRNEGGTSAFGICAILLGFTGSAVNYVEIKESTILWLQLLIWTILLWQSWISFWWWVSTGMYAGEVAERDKKDKRRVRRAEKKRARQRRAAGGALASVAIDGSAIETTSSRIARRMGLGTLRRRNASSSVADRTDALQRQDSGSSAARLTRIDSNHLPAEAISRRRVQPDEPEAVEMDNMGEQQASRSNESSSDPSDTTAPNAVVRLLNQGWTGRIFNRLSLAHHQATRNRAMELPFSHRSAEGTGPFQVFNAVDEIAQSQERNRSAPPSRPVEATSPTAHPAHDSHMPDDSWMWRGRIREARLREVNHY